MTGSGEVTAIGARLDSTAALVRAESAQLDATLEALVSRLAAVPGVQITVRRRHGWLRRLVGDLPYLNGLHRRDDPIHKLTVTLGSRAYWLEADRSSIRCWTEVSSTDRGLVTEQLRFEAWATALFDEIARENLVNYASLVALRQLVVHDQVD
jgi:hypothetical protein